MRGGRVLLGGRGSTHHGSWGAVWSWGSRGSADLQDHRVRFCWWGPGQRRAGGTYRGSLGTGGAGGARLSFVCFGRVGALKNRGPSETSRMGSDLGGPGPWGPTGRPGRPGAPFSPDAPGIPMSPLEPLWP